MREAIFIEFIRYCVNDKVALPKDMEKMDWAGLFRFCQEQAIAGVVFQRIEELKDRKIEIPREVLLPWFALSEQIKQWNILMNKRCVELVQELQRDGFKCCVLKGQGNAIMYPNPLWRTPGDIDVWVRGKNIHETILYVRKQNPEAKATFHHVDYGNFKGIEVEVHYRPTYLNSFIINHRLQKWINDHEEGEFRNRVSLCADETISVPTWEFNVIYQLIHMYKHVVQHGLGFKQLIDYYYLLMSEGRCQKEDVVDTLKYLRLTEIAGAVMYVMREVFGMEEQYMIVPVDERRGTVLLNEILKGGNFGKYDEANIKANSQLKKNIQRIRRDVGMMRYFPSECLWEPLFRIYHFFWRIKWN